MNESNKHPIIAPEHSTIFPKEAKLWIRRMSLLLLFSASTALGAEKSEAVESWAGKSFICYASGKKEAMTEASKAFKSKFGMSPEEAGATLSIDFNEDTGRTMVTVARKDSKTEATKTESWVGKTFSCYASDKKEASMVAAETFKAKFDTTQEQAGVELAIEFNAGTGKALVTVVKKASKTEHAVAPAPWTGKTYSCYASDKKEAEIEAAKTFKAKFGKSPKEAEVELAVEFSEATGKATVTVKQKEPLLTTPDIPSKEIPELSVKLFEAITGNNLREAIVALQKGANPNIPVLGTPPLLAAIGKNDTEMVQLLIEKGASVNASMPADIGAPGFTPLMWACANGQSPIARLLVDKGANLNASDPDGLTPLVAAISSGDLGLVQFLIEKGATPNTRDKKGATPMDYAIRLGNQPLVELLAKHGAHYPRGTR